MKRGLVLTTILVMVLAGAMAMARILAVSPAPTLGLTVPSTLGLDTGTPPPIPLPATGSLAVQTDRDGTLVARDADVVRPMASVAKTMTALAVLDAHPLSAGQDGPSLAVTATDVGILRTVVAEGGSNAPVVLGEQLTERQLLLGLMLPSANNYAIMLGRWVDGSDAAFVARLNARTTTMGMLHTHFADPDGLLAATVSTPSDLLILGRAAVASDTLLSITTQSSATLPDGSVIYNIDTEVGTVPGWLGIKTGHTTEAGYCLLFALRRSVASDVRPITVVGVVMGLSQRADTFAAASAAADAVFAGYVAVDTSTLRLPFSGRVTTDWGAQSDLVTSAPSVRTLVVRRGTLLSLTSSPSPIFAAPLPSGTVVALVKGSLASGESVSWTLSTASPVDSPSWWWRLWHG